MNLSYEERQALASMELRAHRSTWAVEEELGVPHDHLVHHIQELEQRAIVRKRPLIDPQRLGLWEFVVRLKVDNPRRVSDLLLHSEKLAWLITTDDPGELVFSIKAPSFIEAADIFDEELMMGFRSTILHRSVAARRGFTFFGRKYLYPAGEPGAQLRHGIVRERYEPSEQERRILEILAFEDLSIERLAGELKISADSVLSSLRDLRTAEVITGYVYDLDFEHVDVTHAKLFCRIPDLSVRLRNHLQTFAAKHPNVLYLAEYFGEWDLEFGVEVEEAERLLDIHTRLRERFKEHVEQMDIVPVRRYLRRENYSF